MATEPADSASLLSALREAAAALETGTSLEQVRQDLTLSLAHLWPWRDSAQRPSAADRDTIDALLRRNEMLQRAVNRLTLDVQVLLDVLHRGEPPPEETTG